MYFLSEGNSNLRSYESPYRRSKWTPLGPVAGTAHNFSGPSDPPRYFQPVYIPSGGILISSFQWDEPSFSASGVGPKSDLDIYLIDSHGNMVAAGTLDNIASGEPVEVFGYFNDTPDVKFYLVVGKYAGPDPTLLNYILYGDALFYLTPPPVPALLSSPTAPHPT